MIYDDWSPRNVAWLKFFVTMIVVFVLGVLCLAGVVAYQNTKSATPAQMSAVYEMMTNENWNSLRRAANMEEVNHVCYGGVKFVVQAALEDDVITGNEYDIINRLCNNFLADS